MLWLMAFIAALVIAAIASDAPALFGFVVGFALVAALGLLRRQSLRIDALVAELRRIGSASTPAGPAVPAASVPAGPLVPAASPAAPLEHPASSPSTPPPIPAATATPMRSAPAVERVQSVARAAEDGFAARLRRLLFEGNLPVKLGLLVSLFGVGALVRYAAQAGLLDLPVPLRYAGIALVAIGLLLYGLRQAPQRPAFGLSLQGGAIGMLLLVVFGAYRLSALLPAPLAFALVLGLVAGAAVLAIRQNAAWLAAIGFLGGYLAPILLATGGGDHIALFSYYALLNGAVFAMAWIRPWRALNLIGFVFTFGVGALWGSRYFEPALFATTEPFLVLFFLMYVSIPVAYALKGREPGKIDATLLFGTPLLAFPMQAALLDGARLPIAFSALGVGAVYLLIALWSRREPRLRVLGQSAAALGLAFATLAVPLALSARWTSAAWALQGLALLWLGQVQQRRWPQAAGLALQGLAGIAYLVAFEAAVDAYPILNPHTLNLLLLAAAAGGCAWLLDRVSPDHRSIGAAVMAVVALAWWCWAGLREVVEHAGWGHSAIGIDVGPAWLLFIASSAVLAAALRRHGGWRKPAWLPAILLPAALPAVGLAFIATPSWLVQPQGLALPILAASLALVLPTLRDLRWRLGVSHVAGLAALCLALGLGIREGLAALSPTALGEGWRWVLPWLPLALLAALLARRPRLAGWPLGEAIAGHRRIALGLAAATLAVVWLASLGIAGSATPLPWLPVLNPLELFHLAGVLALAAWRAELQREGLRLVASVALVLAAFAAGTMATLRAALHGSSDVVGRYGTTGVDWASIAGGVGAQAALSVVWAVAGVVCWVLGSRRGSRGLWSVGAALLGLVLLKLLLVDRANLGDLLGIVSFLAVGGLLVVVGRIAPRPPSRPAAVATDRQPPSHGEPP